MTRDAVSLPNFDALPAVARPDGAIATRFVDRHVIHGEAIDFRELCRRAVPTSTRYLVLDLDRTVHLARNMGELLGWEITAHRGYGAAYLDELEATRGDGRVFLARSRPLAALKYLYVGLQTWGLPGLYYLLWGKVASHAAPLRRRSYLRFGHEPTRMVQRVPQHALLHELASLPLTTLRELATRVWQRHAPELVIEKEDIAWLRHRCPGIRVIISSASPQPMLEVAAEALGVDDVVFSRVEEHDGQLASPCDTSWMARLPAAPERISRPSYDRINSGPAKLDELVARYPDLRDPNVESVGVTDTGYGEDHSWTRLFTRVVDINSTAPFPPVVPAESPTRAIHSAIVLTRRERDLRAQGNTDYLDPQRGPTYTASDLSRADLEARIGNVAVEIERLALEHDARAVALADERAALKRAAAEIDRRLEDAVVAYNGTAPDARAEAMRSVRRELAARAAATRRLVRAERPLSAIACQLAEQLEVARARLGVTAAPPSGPLAPEAHVA